MSTATPTHRGFRLVGIDHAPLTPLFDGPLVANEIVALLADPDVAYVHLHNAEQGCFSCLVVRA